MILPPSLPSVFTSVVFVVLVLIGLVAPLIVESEDIAAFRRSYLSRARDLAPLLALLGLVLVINSVARDVVPELSWVIGVNVTGLIHGFEHDFIAVVQSFRTTWLTAYFSFIYIYGYVFLLVFPFLAYGVLEDQTPFRTLVITYIVNYAVGLVCYAVFIAYGPRNLMPEQVQPLLYANYPEFKLLTTEVNTNTNVFPSLHTSLALTVAILAWRTDEIYPRWRTLAALLAVSVMVATMYLGIHWLTDVVAAVPLAVLSVVVATRYSTRGRPDTATPE